MVSRTTRLADTLEALQKTPVDTDTLSKHRTIHQDELQTIATQLEIPLEKNSPTTPHYRQAIRNHLDHLSNSKSPNTPFSTDELRDLSRALNATQWFSATDVLQVLEHCHDTARLEIGVNGTTYTVAEYDEQRDINAPGYEGYLAAVFKQDKRLIAFHDWNNDGCYYKTGAALERKTGHIPYVRWKRDAYITSLDPAPSDTAGGNLY